MPTDNTNMSQESTSSGALSGAAPDTDTDATLPLLDTVIARDLHHGTVTWPADTDVIFVSGTRKVTLCIQLPLMRSIILDAVEQVRISLLFTDAFPDAFAALSVIRARLIAAAASRLPIASEIHKRLVCDVDYMIKMIRLVSCILF